MAQTVDPTEPMNQLEVGEQVEYMTQDAASIYGFILRAQAQGASQLILSELWKAYYFTQDAAQKLEWAKQFFPPK